MLARTDLWVSYEGEIKIEFFWPSYYPVTHHSLTHPTWTGGESIKKHSESVTVEICLPILNWPIEIDNKWRLHIAYTCNCPASAGNTVLLLGIRSVPHALWEADQSIHSSLKKKNTIRNGGSTTLYGAYTVDMVYTVDKRAGAFYSAGQSKDG